MTKNRGFDVPEWLCSASGLNVLLALKYFTLAVKQECGNEQFKPDNMNFTVLGI